MRYQCVQCDEQFDVEDDAERPRCPKCMRQHGLRKVPPPSRAPAPSEVGARSRFRWPLAVVVALGLAAGAYVYRQRAERADNTTADEARAAGVDAGALGELLVADAHVERFAEQAVAGASSPRDKAKAVVAALAARAQKQAFVRGTLAEPWDAAPRVAKQVVQAIAKDGARAQLFPLEAAVLAVAALRSVQVPAVVVEVYRYAGERSPLDPSGRLGYHGFSLPGPDGTVAEVFDAYGARSASPSAGDYTALTDAQALGAALALRALHRLSSLGDAQAALADADAAVKLAPASPSVRSARAAVMMASGGAEQGARELEAAVQLRSDAARHNNVALLALAKGEVERAQKEVALALGNAPDFAAAQLTLASVHMSRGERELARAALEQAERLEPNLTAVALAWAEWYASSGDLAQALAKAELGVRLRPKNPETHLVLGRVYRQAGRYDDMRIEAQKVLALSTVTDKERVKALLREVLGPTALEAPTAPADLRAPADAPLLDGPQVGSSAPGGLKLGAGEPKLRLGGGGDELKLKLDP